MTDRALTVGEAIGRWAKAKGGASALVGMGAPGVTFSQLHASISEVAAHLQSAGLSREDRVGLLVPAGIPGGQLVVALASNVTLVPVNPALTRHELIELSKVSGLKAVVIPSGLDPPSRSAMLEQDITVFEAVLAPQGVLGLERLTPASGAPRRLRSARETDVALLLRSSGTMGAPKLIPVTHRNLLAMAEKLGSDLWFGLTAEDRAACILPLFYAAGLKTSLFVPLLLGASVGFPAAGQALDIAKWVNVLKPTYLSVAPGALNGILDRLRDSAHDFDGPSLRFVMCAAAYLPEDVWRAALSLLRVPVLEFYGLSEAGVMAANPVAPGRIRPGTVGLPAPGELLVVDETRAPVARGAVGQIMISGPTVTPGYVAAEDPAGELKDGWLLTGDLGRIDEEGYLTIVGRVKEVINRGGEKVFPYEIEKAILQHPAVHEAAAFGVPHPRLGENVAAAVVLKRGSTVSEQALMAFLAERLAGFKLPRRLRFVSSLPRGTTGKVLRSSLREAYAAAPGGHMPPDDLLEVELRDLWARLLGVEDIGVDDDFFEKGGDSLLATEMLLELERLTGKPYPRSELSTLTISRMADVVTSGLAGDSDVITQVRGGSGVPLFFCHGDYFTRGLYAHKLATLLADDRPVFLLHYDPERLIGCSIEEMAGAYLQEVLRVAPDSPVFVGGWCNGGLAAWHLTHLLRRKGVQVVELLLVDALSLNARPGLRGLAKLCERAGAIVPGRGGRFLREKAMPVAWTARRTKGMASYTTLLYRAARKAIGRVLRRQAPRQTSCYADRTASRTRLLWTLGESMSRYIPPRIDVEVTCFIAEEGQHFDTAPGFWRDLAASVSEVRVPGTHLTAVVSERQALAVALGEVLARASARYLSAADQRKRVSETGCDAEVSLMLDGGAAIGAQEASKM